jgi:hypothetical protein
MSPLPRRYGKLVRAGLILPEPESSISLEFKRGKYFEGDKKFPEVRQLGNESENMIGINC